MLIGAGSSVSGQLGLALAAVEDMLREAHEHAEDNNWSALSFLAGFALFLVVSEHLSG